MHRASFLEMFPDNCQDQCLVAKAAAAIAARQVAELGLTFDKISEVLAHRFGKCVLGPEVVGDCGEEKTVCHNEIVSGVEEFEAAEALAAL